jgi:hypothetical protein
VREKKKKKSTSDKKMRQLQFTKSEKYFPEDDDPELLQAVELPTNDVQDPESCAMAARSC